MQPIEVVIISGMITLAGVVLSGLLARWTQRNAQRHESTAPGAPTVQEIWKRQDNMEKGMRAALVIIGELAEQWDGTHPPKLSKRAINTLRELDYLPVELDHLLPEQETE